MLARRFLILLLCLVAGPHLLLPQNSPSSPANRPPTFRISGKTVNSQSNEPLAGVEVTIASTVQPGGTYQTITANDGSFVFENLGPGKFSLSARRHGVSGQAYQQHGVFSTAIAVGPGLESENLVFPLPLEASITGQVLDEENEPVRTGQVYLFAQTNDTDSTVPLMRTSAILDDQGKYRFAHLPPGTYFVVVMAQPWYAQDVQLPAGLQSVVTFDGPTVSDQAVAAPDSPPQEPDTQGVIGPTANTPTPPATETPAPSPLDVAYPTTYYPGATDPDSASPITLHPGERFTADFNLRVVPGLHLKIRTGQASANFPASVQVMQRLFHRADNAPLGLAVRTQQIAPGLLAVSGIAPGHMFITVHSTNGKQLTEFTKEVDASSDMEIDGNDTPSSTVFIKGIVRMPSGKPIPPNSVVAFVSPESGEAFGALVNEKGEFETTYSIVGSTRYTLNTSVSSLLVQNITATGATVSGRTVELPHSGTVQLVVTMSTGAGRVDGTALRDDKPASQVMIFLVPEHPDDISLFRRDQSDSDGTFTLAQILPGRYTAIAVEKGWELDWHNPEALKPYLSQGEPLEVAADKKYKITLKAQLLHSVESASSALQ